MAFTGTLDKCKACDKTVYFVDMMSLEGMPYHKSCFKCTHYKGTLVGECYHKICFRCAHGSEEEANKKIYNVSYERYFGYGYEINEETTNKVEELVKIALCMCVTMFGYVLLEVFYRKKQW